MIYASEWDTYNLKSQRVMQMLLQYCQRPTVIMLGTLGPLNVETLIAVIISEIFHLFNGHLHTPVLMLHFHADSEKYLHFVRRDAGSSVE